MNFDYSIKGYYTFYKSGMKTHYVVLFYHVTTTRV